MNCPTCKNPINSNDSICEWCNSSLNVNSKIKVDSKLLYKGQCIFYSERIKKTYCFFEIYNDEILIFNDAENVNIRILKSIIYNIQITNLFSINKIGFMGLVKGYSIKGWKIITSKSGENIIFLKKQNKLKFYYLIKNYLNE